MCLEMSDIKEITTYITKIYPQVKIYNNISVSYIKTLSEEDTFTFICNGNEDISYKRDNKICNIDSVPNTTNNDCDSLDLTGSPLKDTCHIDTSTNTDLDLDIKFNKNPRWKFEEQNFIPIDMSKSNTIISYIMTKFPKTNIKESIWIFCDGKNNQNIVLLNIKLTNLFNARSVVFYNGIKLADDVNMSEMMKIHINSFGKKIKVHTTVECTFNISPYAYLNVTWNSSSTKLPLNNFRNSDIILFQSVEIGKCPPVTKKLWMELITLINLRNHILDFNNPEKTNEFYFSDGNNYLDIDTIRDKILSLLTDVTTGFREREINTTSELEEIICSIDNRLDLDVIDYLWNILKRCANYQDLKSAISYIFYCTAKYNVVNLPTKQNRLGEIMQEISQHRIAIPCLIGTEPLELLLEIGLEKIFKDYQYIFSVSKMYSPKQLGNLYFIGDLKFDNPEKSMQKIIFSANDNNMDITSIRKKSLFHNFNEKYDIEVEGIEGFQNSKFDENDVNNKLSRLIQIHLTLEHLILIQNHLNLENFYSLLCENMLRKRPKSFQTVLNSSIDKIEIPVTFDDVFYIFNQKIPQTRKVTMSSKNDFKEIKNVFYFDEEKIIPVEMYSSEITNVYDKEFRNKNFYHYWQYTNIKTRRY